MLGVYRYHHHRYCWIYSGSISIRKGKGVVVLTTMLPWKKNLQKEFLFQRGLVEATAASFINNIVI